MLIQNCWQVKKCGREPGGIKSAELGVCPAATESRTNGINDGKNGGRSCWALAGTMCGGKIQGSFASKLSNCLNCDFFKLVQVEQGKTLISTKEILKLV
ncbi:MAG: hypothetical protein KJ571_04160 [Bacteroidetes bacterium]|nr:hypothetical protein [Bacteroidota bacterium]